MMMMFCRRRRRTLALNQKCNVTRSLHPFFLLLLPLSAFGFFFLFSDSLFSAHSARRLRCGYIFAVVFFLSSSSSSIFFITTADCRSAHHRFLVRVVCSFFFFIISLRVYNSCSLCSMIGRNLTASSTDEERKRNLSLEFKRQSSPCCFFI